MPDGSRLVFTNDSHGDYDLYVVNLEDREVTRIRRAAGDELEPDVAPIRFKLQCSRQRGAGGAGATPLDEYEESRLHGDTARAERDLVRSATESSRATPRSRRRIALGESAQGKSCRGRRSQATAEPRLQLRKTPVVHDARRVGRRNPGRSLS